MLDALGPRIRRAEELPAEATARLPTGLPELDALLHGGLPLAALSEITGPDSAGRTALALSLLATTTRSGALAAWVDAAGGFDPLSAEAAGVALARVLWARPERPRAAWRATERLLEARGFALVVLDLAGAEAGGASQCEEEPAPGRASHRSARSEAGHALHRAARDARHGAPGDAAWARLVRSAGVASAALLVLAPARCTGTWSSLALVLEPAGARFDGTELAGASPAPRLLDGLDVRVRLARSRFGPERTTRLRLAAPAA